MLLTTSSLLKVVCCMELVSSTVNIFRFLSVSRMFLANLISNLTSRFPLMKQTLVRGICINLSFGTFHVTDNTLWSDDPGCLPCPVLRSSIRSSLYPSCNVNQNYCWCFWRCWCVGGDLSAWKGMWKKSSWTWMSRFTFLQENAHLPASLVSVKIFVSCFHRRLYETW